MATLQYEYPRYDELLDTVSRTRDWWRTVYILERVLVYVGLLFATVCALTLLEAHLHFRAAVRWPLCIALLAYVLAGMALLVLRPLFHQWTEEEVAIHIERKFPEIDNALINALQLGVDEGVMSPGMVEGLIRRVADEIQAYPVRRAVETRRARYLAGAASVALLALCVWAGLAFDRFSNALQRLILPGRNITALGRVAIESVHPGDARIESGSDLEVVVQTKGGPSGEVEATLFFTYEYGYEGARPHPTAPNVLLLPGGRLVPAPGFDWVVSPDLDPNGRNLRVVPKVVPIGEGSPRTLAKAMSPVSRDSYVCRIEGVRSPLTYSVNIGGTESKSYHVQVIVQPIVSARTVVYKFPSYTHAAGWTDREDSETNGDVRAPLGTHVTLRLTSNNPIREGHLLMSTGERGERRPLRVLEDPRQLEAAFFVEKDGVYTIQLTDTNGISSRDPRENKIIALTDRPPAIEFATPGKDTTAGPGSTVKLVLSGRDDYGIERVSLIARRGKDGPQRVLKTWTEFAAPQRVTLPFTWELGTKEYGYEVGDEIFYYAVARDNHADVTGTREVPKPQETKSSEFKVKIEDKEQIAKAKAERISSWETALRKVLEDQIAARHKVEAVGQALSKIAGNGSGPAPGKPPAPAKDEKGAPAPNGGTEVAQAPPEGTAPFQNEGGELVKAQTDIFTRTATIAKGIQPTDEQAQAVKESITLLAYGEMTRCVKLAQGIPPRKELKALRQGYSAVATSQDRIIESLRRLLNILPELAEKTKGKMDEEDVKDFPDEQQEAMKDLLRNLKEMVREQKKVIETTDELAKLPMEDYTPEQEKKLENVKAIEEKWSQFLKATISDLSKMQQQDFANTSMLQELVEIHTEIEMAKDALSAKATEIATALEDNGLMLAEKLTKQLEKWVPDTPDRDRWQMEEPLTDGYETPMAELPKELEDIVGDLMEEEEDLQQEIEDATSSWADSMDAAGWDAMDGPISNFAANGVTGNRLPNSNEMSGRSGEGRQGQSSGEMVTDEFTGKGGRRTPTRLGSEAFAKGQIKDSSSTPPGGATGGGKAAGSSGEGLEGPPPPDIQMKMKDFALRQAALRNTTEKIALKFEVLNYPPIFEPIVKDMKVLEAALNSGRYTEASRQHGVLLKNLRNTRLFLEGQLSLDQVRSPSLPAHLQEEIIGSASTAVPDEFKDYIKSYYEAISRAK